jgi:hypothetical protein
MFASIKITLLTVLFFILTSCSSPQQHLRILATENLSSKNIKTQDILEVFEFRESNLKQPDFDFRQTLLNFVDDSKLFKWDRFDGYESNEISVEFIEDSSLPKGVAYYPKFLANNDTYKIIIHHSKEAIIDPVASLELNHFLIFLADKEYFLTHFSAFEMYYNAIERDPLAILNWAKIRELAANKQSFNSADIVAELKIRGEEWTLRQADYIEGAKKKLKLMQSQDKERRIAITTLDSATDDFQFKNLVAKNDRIETAKLIKKYLPWEQMAPMEKKYWETYLETIQNPLPIEKRVLVFRGNNDDFIYPAYQNGMEIEAEIAQREGKIFMMSTLITKNQGSWNRRLRSLTAMYKKYIATNADKNDTFTRSARLTSMFFNHSIQPKGSPFLSLTPTYKTAIRFGNRQMGAYLLDPRLLAFNLTSEFKVEVEFLTPLMIFPEDVVAFYNLKIHTDQKNSEEWMYHLFKENMIKRFGETEGDDLYQKILKNSEHYFNGPINRYTEKMTATIPPKDSHHLNNLSKLPLKQEDCADILAKFWK